MVVAALEVTFWLSADGQSGNPSLHLKHDCPNIDRYLLELSAQNILWQVSFLNENSRSRRLDPFGNPSFHGAPPIRSAYSYYKISRE